MDYLQAIQNAINYIEENLTRKIDYEEVSKRAFSSNYHFQRVFSFTVGLTLGEYIRKRKLTLAGSDLLKNKVKVTDVAFKYGYESLESFSRAFYKFHGIMPSRVKSGVTLKSFSRVTASFNITGGEVMNYKIEKLPSITLVGYKKRFYGAPYGEERKKQEEEFLTTTRAKQWLLIGASCDYTTDYMVISNVSDDGYDFYVAYELDEWTRNELYNQSVTGVDFMDKMGFETIVIPEQTNVIFETEKKKRPIVDYVEIRKKIVAEWLPSSNCVFENAPEVIAMHWRPKGEWAKERYIEIRLPIKELE